MTQDQITQVIATLQQLAVDLRGRQWLAPMSAAEINHRDRWLADKIDTLAAALLSLHAPGDQEQETPQKQILVSGAEIHQSEASLDERPTTGNPAERDG